MILDKDDIQHKKYLNLQRKDCSIAKNGLFLPARKVRRRQYLKYDIQVNQVKCQKQLCCLELELRSSTNLVHQIKYNLRPMLSHVIY